MLARLKQAIRNYNSEIEDAIRTGDIEYFNKLTEEEISHHLPNACPIFYLIRHWNKPDPEKFVLIRDKILEIYPECCAVDNALQWATEYPDAQAAAWLLMQRDSDRWGNKKRSLELKYSSLKYMYEECTALHYAIIKGNAAVAEAILKKYPDLINMFLKMRTVEHHRRGPETYSKWIECSPLYLAIRFNETQLIDVLLKYGADPSLCSYYTLSHYSMGGGTYRERGIAANELQYLRRKNYLHIKEAALIKAIKSNKIDQINTFFSENAPCFLTIPLFSSDEISKGMTALHYAAFYDSVEASKLIINMSKAADKAISAKDAHNRIPFHIALVAGNLATVKYIYSLCSKTTKDWLINRENIERVYYIDIRRNWEYKSLHCAIDYGHIDIVDWLLANGAYPNATYGKNTPLHLAVMGECNSGAIVQLLLNHKSTKINVRNSDGLTALEIAITKGKLEVIQALFNHPDIDKADIERRSYHHNPALYYAITNNYSEVAVCLIEQGADVTQGDCFSHASPLHLVVTKTNFSEQAITALTQSIIDHRAEVNSLDVNKETPLDYAIRANNEIAIRVLRRAGAIRGKDLSQPQNSLSTESSFLTFINELRRDYDKEVTEAIKYGNARYFRNLRPEEVKQVAKAKPLHKLIEYFEYFNQEQLTEVKNAIFEKFKSAHLLENVFGIFPEIKKVETPFHVAARSNNLNAMKWLLSLSRSDILDEVTVDESVIEKCLHQYDDNQDYGRGYTPLHLAVAYGRQEMVSLIANKYSSTLKQNYEYRHYGRLLDYIIPRYTNYRIDQISDPGTLSINHLRSIQNKLIDVINPKRRNNNSQDTPQLQIVKTIIEANSFLIDFPLDDTGLTALDFAAESDQEILDFVTSKLKEKYPSGEDGKDNEAAQFLQSIRKKTEQKEVAPSVEDEQEIVHRLPPLTGDSSHLAANHSDAIRENSHFEIETMEGVSSVGEESCPKQTSPISLLKDFEFRRTCEDKRSFLDFFGDEENPEFFSISFESKSSKLTEHSEATSTLHEEVFNFSKKRDDLVANRCEFKPTTDEESPRFTSDEPIHVTIPSRPDDDQSGIMAIPAEKSLKPCTVADITESGCEESFSSAPESCATAEFASTVGIAGGIMATDKKSDIAKIIQSKEQEKSDKRLAELVTEKPEAAQTVSRTSSNRPVLFLDDKDLLSTVAVASVKKMPKDDSSQAGVFLPKGIADTNASTSSNLLATSQLPKPQFISPIPVITTNSRFLKTYQDFFNKLLKNPVVDQNKEMLSIKHALENARNSLEKHNEKNDLHDDLKRQIEEKKLIREVINNVSDAINESEKKLKLCLVFFCIFPVFKLGAADELSQYFSSLQEIKKQLSQAKIDSSDWNFDLSNYDVVKKMRKTNYNESWLTYFSSVFSRNSGDQSSEKNEGSDFPRGVYPPML